MKKEETLQHMISYNSFMEKVCKIIGYKDITSEPIWDCTEHIWSYNKTDGQLFIDRGDDEGLYGYAAQQISSMGAKGEEFFMGESDGLTYVIGHDESENWDDTYILILDNNNKESLTIDE